MALSRGAQTRLKDALFHITTPIFYPNAKPHLGHLYSSLLCDVSSRWRAMQGYNTLFTTGTDEHGLKIQNASEKNGYSNPKQFVDVLYREFVKLDQMANIGYTRFIRTTDEDHIRAVRELWNRCWERGYIYKGEHEGWYSISDECFYPESKVVQLQDNGQELPVGSLKIREDEKFINIETRNEVVYHSESNYFFKLSSFQTKLLEFLETENPHFIYPPSRRDQIVNELRDSKLRDLSISRPSSRIKWGIDVPQDPSQKIYVWFDALCNYLSSVGGLQAILSNSQVSVKHTFTNQLEKPRDLWANTTHVIGKDIAKFHTIYWPSFLMAAGVPLPKKVVVHGHWLSGGIKMSKSIGNVVDPLDMISHYECDPVRWYLLENSHIEADGDFREERLHATREQIVSKWGNLLNRCCSNRFSISRAVETFAGQAATPEDNAKILAGHEVQESYLELVQLVKVLPELYSVHMQQLETRAALKLLWDVIGKANVFVQVSTPWLKSGKEQDLIIFTAIEIVRLTSILAQPIIPTLSNAFLDRIGVDKDSRDLSCTHLGADLLYGKGSNDKAREVPIKKVKFRGTT
ncbi:LAQU0S17e00474g1_1 [Lachancea quebecensis]|uniref:Methionine--tRNA ligase, mitochondrial n=1 Tax=Lachancea quebecensis TaxID=1654605 RepID=A0A0N7MM99_9SACH|nr:LAQU0S17e00474g1_1 [Lachancea quebecensis]